MSKEPSYEELKAQLARVWEQSAEQKSPAIPDRVDPRSEPSVLDASPYRECIAKLQWEFWNSPPSRTCPVCGKQHIEREKSALELWEAFLNAGPAGEKVWHRRMLGRLLQLANYILIIAAFVAIFTAGWYVVSGEIWLVMRTFLWWLPVLAALIVLVPLRDWWKRRKASRRGE